MAVGNPHFTDDKTGEIYLLDESGFKRLNDKFESVTAVMSIEQFRILFETIQILKKETDNKEILKDIKYTFEERKKDS